MKVLDFGANRTFSPHEHVQTFLDNTPQTRVSIVCWEPGQESPWHCHTSADEFYYVVEGRALMETAAEGQQAELRPGMGLLFPAGTMHRVRSLQRSVFLRVHSGPDPERIVRRV